MKRYLMVQCVNNPKLHIHFKESLYIWEQATCSYHVCCLITFIMIINFQIVKKKSLLYLICPTPGIYLPKIKQIIYLLLYIIFDGKYFFFYSYLMI